MSIPGSISAEPSNSTNKYLELDKLGSTNKVKQMKAMVIQIFAIIAKIKLNTILRIKIQVNEEMLRLIFLCLKFDKA